MTRRDSLEIGVFLFRSPVDQNKDGQINRKDMTKIIEAMYDLANEEDRTGEKSPDKRVDVIMQRLNKEKSGKKKKNRRCPFDRSIDRLLS